MLWAPTADAVKVNIYDNGLDSLPIRSVDMLKKNGGQWIVTVHEDLHDLIERAKLTKNS
jgi:hypothetical protein